VLGAVTRHAQDLSEVVTALEAGCRPSKLLSLIWPGVDRRGVVTVRAGDTKNRKARDVPVNDTLTMSLKSGKLHAAEGGHSCALNRVNRVAHFTSRMQVRCVRQAFKALRSTIDAIGSQGVGLGGCGPSGRQRIAGALRYDDGGAHCAPTD